MTQAESVLASLADGMLEAELDRIAAQRASTTSETRDGTGTLARHVYPDRSRLRARRSNTRPGVLVDAVSPTSRLTASRLIDPDQTPANLRRSRCRFAPAWVRIAGIVGNRSEPLPAHPHGYRHSEFR